MPIDRKSYEPITGNPRRKTKKKEDTRTEAGEEKGHTSTSSIGPHGDRAGTGGGPQGPTREQDGAHRTPQGRTRRVKVTPRDWAELKAMADRLGGLPYAKVYNVAFEALREKIGRDESSIPSR